MGSTLSEPGCLSVTKIFDRHLSQQDEAIEFDAWLLLSGALMSRLAGRVPGLVIDLIAEADRLDRASLEPTEMIEALGTFAVARGRRRRDADRTIQAARKRARDHVRRAA